MIENDLPILFSTRSDIYVEQNHNAVKILTCYCPTLHFCFYEQNLVCLWNITDHSLMRYHVPENSEILGNIKIIF